MTSALASYARDDGFAVFLTFISRIDTVSGTAILITIIKQYTHTYTTHTTYGG